MPLFNRKISGREADLAVLNKKPKASSAKPKQPKGIIALVEMAEKLVNAKLEKYREEVEMITDFDYANKYIDDAIANGIISIDTETDGLNVFRHQIAGLCLYTPNRKACYIPLNHIDYITEQKIPNQITIEQARILMQKVKDSGIKVIMFNANFDIRVIKHWLGVTLTCYWDCELAQRCIYSAEKPKKGENGLKKIYTKWVLNGKDDDSYSFGSLFKGIISTKIPLHIFYLYAAVDAKVTLELYNWQVDYYSKPENKDLLNLLMNIEMPVVPIVISMEDTGITLDMEYNKQLSVKYHELLDKYYEKCSAVLNSEPYSSKIAAYRVKHPNNKLGDPINVMSNTQLAIIFYDIMGYKHGLKKKEVRATDEDVLNELLKKYNDPLCKNIVEYKKNQKLLGTYIDKMPEIIEDDGKIHCVFNQYGADTGRFSSQDPNMQNIPSHNHDIRKMFVAQKDHVLLGADFSAQEPRITAYMSQDEKMLGAYKAGKDVYVEIASLAFNFPYNDCLEFQVDANGKYILDEKGEKIVNQAGKERRNRAKKIVLGLNYGMSDEGLAEQLNITKAEASELKNKVLSKFTGLANFKINSEKMASEKGYVTTMYGRRRWIEDMLLPKYELKYIDSNSSFNPFFDDEDYVDVGVPAEKQKFYIDKIKALKPWDKNGKQAIRDAAKREGIEIIDNGYKISEAERKCVNSRIQGSASDQTKKAMIILHNNKELQDLGFRILLQVHDELICECPEKNKDRCVKLFEQGMLAATADTGIPGKCDVSIVHRWYEDVD